MDNQILLPIVLRYKEVKEVFFFLSCCDALLSKTPPFFTNLSSKTLFTWSGGPRSRGVGFFCFHALRGTKQKKLTPLDRGPPLHVNRV